MSNQIIRIRILAKASDKSMIQDLMISRIGCVNVKSRKSFNPENPDSDKRPNKKI